VGVGFMRFVPIDFINRLKIVVPSLEEQRAFVNNYQASLVNKLGIEVDQLKTQQANEFERNMHLRKHALKQVLNEVVPASRRIANFISSQDGAFCKDAIIAERSKSTLNEYSQKLFRNVEKIQRLIAALTDDENYPEAKTFDFATFVAVYRHKKITDDKYRLLWFGESHFFGDEPEMPTDVAPGDHREIQAAQLTAHMAPTALETVLDNLIANAVNHGFVDDQRMDYGIKILFTNILVEGTMMLEVRVMNNGAKLPDGMTPDRVFTWGIGSGTGLGSWQVKNIIEHYGGSVEFIQHDDAPDGYNIEYRIVIPMS
jgi:signal transduction histidine kinase